MSLNFNYKVKFQRFLYQTYKIYPTGFSIWRLGHAPGVGLWDAGCTQGDIFFFKHDRVAYQIDGDRMQVNFHPWSNRWPLGDVKRSNIIKFQLQCHFQNFLYQTLCVFSEIKIENILNFFSVAWIMPQGVELGVKNFSVGICDGAPSTVRCSYRL